MEKQRGIEFENIASPDAAGISGEIYIKDLPLHLNVTNGSNFSRANSYLDKKYYLIKKYEKDEIDTRTQNQREGIGKGKLISIQLNGLKK